MNFLIASVGRRTHLVKWFKEELNKEKRKLYVTDRDQDAPALYFADKYFLLDSREYTNEYLYIQILIKECKELNITHILSLHDTHILTLSKYKQEFIANNINLLLNDYEINSICLDKTRYEEFPINQIPTVIIKDRYGSASQGVEKVKQPLIDGKEYNIQCYFDIHTKKLIDIFMQEKISMRSGETERSISIWDDEIAMEIKKLDGFLKGVIDIDVIKGDKVYIIDINPRFGGGYPLAHYCGKNYVQRLIENASNKQMLPGRGRYKLGIKMMKYNGLYFKDK